MECLNGYNMDTRLYFDYKVDTTWIQYGYNIDTIWIQYGYNILNG